MVRLDPHHALVGPSSQPSVGHRELPQWAFTSWRTGSIYMPEPALPCMHATVMDSSLNQLQSMGHI